jgi:hypothetical protein
MVSEVTSFCDRCAFPINTVPGVTDALSAQSHYAHNQGDTMNKQAQQVRSAFSKRQAGHTLEDRKAEKGELPLDAVPDLVDKHRDVSARAPATQRHDACT